MPLDAAALGVLGGRAERPRLGLEADGLVLVLGVGVDGVGGLVVVVNEGRVRKYGEQVIAKNVRQISQTGPFFFLSLFSQKMPIESQEG